MSNEEIVRSSELYREDVMTRQKGLTLAAILLYKNILMINFT